MKKWTYLLFGSLLFNNVNAQSLAINTDGSAADNSAILHVKSNTKGMLIPQLTFVERNAISLPANGLLIYQTDNTPGFYYNSGTVATPVWEHLVTSNSSGWLLSGNAGINETTHFIGTTDAQGLRLKVNSIHAGLIDSNRLFLGYRAGNSTTTTKNNTAIGDSALLNIFVGENNVALGKNALTNTTTGNRNVSVGSTALNNNISGSDNVGIGDSALFSITTSSLGATAVGSGALRNGGGNLNTAIGYKSQYKDASGSYNTSTGYQSLYNNTDGGANTAMGYQSMYNSSTSAHNSAFGYQSLYNITIGQGNTAFGDQSLYNNLSGFYNTSSGLFSLVNNTTGGFNSAYGYESLFNCNGSNNVGIGDNAGDQLTTGVNNIIIGSSAQVPINSGNNQVRIGNFSITYAGVQVAWTITSDLRYKNHIAPLPDNSLLLIQSLKPVSYKRIGDDNPNRSEIGFIAQDLEPVLKKLGYETEGIISKDAKGYYGVRYNDFIPLLVKGVQELQALIAKQNLKFELQEKEIELLQQQIAELKQFVKSQTVVK